MRTLLYVLCLCLLAGCKPTPPPPSPAPATSANVVTPAAPVKPAITGLPATMTVKQRTQTPIPGSSDSLVLSIGDITRGKVEASVRTEKEVLLQPVFMASSERQSFEFQQRTYELALTELNNALVGEDFATFKLTESTPGEALTEQQKIERLIVRVESLTGAVFNRNGNEHSPQDAAKHLRDKRHSAGEKLKSAEEFIEQTASRSSLSGNDYKIRFADGRVVKTRDFLQGELKNLASERLPQPAAPR